MTLRDQLLAMRDEDLGVRQKLADAGELGSGYHWRMEAVHRANAARLREIIERHGWPGKSLAGTDGAEAAWLVVQHAIGEPEFQRSALQLLNEAVRNGEAPARQAAYLVDRIRVLEGKPQVYGTQYAWNDDGVMAPCPIKDPESVEERRAAVGLPTLAAAKRGADPEPVSRDQVERERREMDAWARRVGWRS